MKHIFILFVLTFNLNIIPQSVKYSEDYQIKYETEKGEIIEYTLFLHANGTFLFHSYRKLVTLIQKKIIMVKENGTQKTI